MSTSTELRRDPVTGRLAIVAAGRAARPHTVAAAPPEHDAGPEHCPFCPGHEAMTPPEVARVGGGAADEPGWRVRVVPNLYPIVGGEDAAPGARGVHEVAVLSPDHRASFGRLPDAAAIEVFRVLRARLATHFERGLPYGVALLNHRRAAGASIAHPHAQVVALDFVPPEVEVEARRAEGHVDDLLAADLDTARTHGTVLVDGDVASWFPHAAGSPCTLRIAHRSAPARFDQTADSQLDSCALALRDALARLGDALADPPYNVTVHTAAADGTGVRRWYVEITPRLSVVAGFEMATGILVNTTPAEQAIALGARRRAMITVHVCTTIGAPVEVVWSAVERIETHTEWMRDAVSIEFENEQRAGVGTAFACLTRVGPLSTTDHFVVTRWEPPTLMAIDHRGAVKGDADFELRELGDRTQFCWEERLRFPWWLGGPVGEQIGQPILRRLWQGNIERLKTLVEAR